MNKWITNARRPRHNERFADELFKSINVAHLLADFSEWSYIYIYIPDNIQFMLGTDVMTSSNGDTLLITGPLCEESPDFLRGQYYGALMFSLLLTWRGFCTNSQVTGDSGARFYSRD